MGLAAERRLQAPGTRVKLGIGIVPQNHPDWGRYDRDAWDAPAEVSDASLYADGLALVRRAEDLGLQSVWTVEHHFTPYIVVPNPIQFLTYVAAATTRMEVGTMVTVLPWHHPLRLAGEVAMLDILLGGRKLHLGLGRGTAKVESDASRSIRRRRARVLRSRSTCCVWRCRASVSRSPASFSTSTT